MFILTSCLIFAQETVKEPEFVGDGFFVNANGSTVKLEKEKVKIKTKTGVSIYLTGYGKVKTKLDVDGCCSEATVKPEGEIKIIVRALNNEIDPLESIQVFKLTQKKSKRTAEIASYGSFTGESENDLDNLDFTGEKYGESSYLLTIANYEKNTEYGILVKASNLPLQATTVISTFAVE